MLYGEQCLALAKRYFPAASDRDIHDLLWGATAFPFATVKYIDAQLAHLAACANDIDTAIWFAEEASDLEWREYQAASVFPGGGQ